MAERVLAFGDVHGCNLALASLLKELQITSSDTVIFLGDVVDRGPDTSDVIEQLIDLQKKCNLIFIKGNHEEMMLDAMNNKEMYNSWLEVGGMAVVNSYRGSLDNIPTSHIKFLSSAVAYYKTDAEIFIHASLQNDVKLKNQTALWLRWTHITGREKPRSNGKRIVCGHTSQKNGMPMVWQGWACIDTFAHGGQYLSCLDVESNTIYQAPQRGELRSFPLPKEKEEES